MEIKSYICSGFGQRFLAVEIGSVGKLWVGRANVICLGTVTVGGVRRQCATAITRLCGATDQQPMGSCYVR